MTSHVLLDLATWTGIVLTVSAILAMAATSHRRAGRIRPTRTRWA